MRRRPARLPCRAGLFPYWSRPSPSGATPMSRLDLSDRQRPGSAGPEAPPVGQDETRGAAADHLPPALFLVQALHTPQQLIDPRIRSRLKVRWLVLSSSGLF